MDLQYRLNTTISKEQFVDLLNRSTLGARRPIDDLTCMQGMLDNANILATAWHNDTLVGISRCVTDFHYCCYLSDLAVDKNYQHKGIGKILMDLCQQQLKPNCKLILLSAPDANDYYPKVGFQNNERCWVLMPNQKISGFEEA